MQTAEMRVDKFTASVSQNLIGKADRFFNHSIYTIFTELVQNSRRAGATQLDVTIEDAANDCLRITMIDNGVGIADPRTLLTLGQSAWNSEDIATIEDPAGMGFFSLAGFGCIVKSRDWSMELTKEQFLGSAPAEAIHGAGPSIPGTCIEFVVSATPENGRTRLDTAIRKLTDTVRYCPLQVNCNGKPLSQSDFLYNSIFTRMYKGVRIGIVPSSRFYSHTSEHRVNFFGLTAKAPVSTVSGYDYTVAVDVTPENRELRLELPARSRVVENDFWAEIKTESHKMLFESILEHKNGKHTLSYKEWKTGYDLGIVLPEPPAELWDIDQFSEDNQCTSERGGGQWDEKKTDINNPSDFVKVSSEAFDGVLHTLPLISDTASKDIELVGYEPSYGGYRWYDAIPTLEKIIVRDENGRVLYKCGLENEDDLPDPSRDMDTTTESMTIELHVSGRGEPYVYDLPALLVRTDDYYGDLDEATYCISRKCIDAADGIPDLGVEEAMWRTYWDYRQDSDCDTYDTQQDHFENALSCLLNDLFLGSQAAARRWLEHEIGSWTFSANLRAADIKSMTVGVKGDKINIKFK